MKMFLFSTTASISLYAIAWGLLLGVVQPKKLSEQFFTQVGEAYTVVSETMVPLK